MKSILSSLMLAVAIVGLAGGSRTASAGFEEYFKECPGGWIDTRYGNQNPPLCFQLLKDYSFDIPLAYFTSKIFDYKNLPVNFDSRLAPVGIPRIYWGNNNWGDKILEHAETKVPPSGLAINLDTDSEKKFFILEADGVLTIKKGYRWDGPTTAPVKKPDDYKEVLMNATLIHDVLYDLMRMKKIPREGLVPKPWKDGFRNRLLADNLFYMISSKDASFLRAEFWWNTVRLGGWVRAREDTPDWKSHALADAGQYSPIQCASTQGTNVTLDGSQSRFAESWLWTWSEGTEEKTASDEITLPQFFEPGTHTVTLKVDCLLESPDCHDHYMDTDEATITVIPDSMPPVISGISAPIRMWPPNHKYATFTLQDYVESVQDNCTVLSPQDLVIVRVTSDEPEDSNGDGHTINDIVILPDRKSVKLRRERRAKGNGRVYTIYFAAIDENENTTTGAFLVHIPLSEWRDVIDDGSSYQQYQTGLITAASRQPAK